MPAGQVRRSSVRANAIPTSQGLYDPAFEHDACGVGFVADLTGRRGHDIVQKALTVLRNLDHRGASGADPDDGDGAGILTQIPHELFTEVCDFALPEAGAYAAGIAFLPADAADRAEAVAAIDRIVAEEGLTLLGWRELPFEPRYSGPAARQAMPYFGQLFITGTPGTATGGLTGIDLERHAYCVRKRAEHEADVYFPSLSPRTIAYKGMLTTPQLEPFFPDLSDRRYTSGLALVHSRFSTNTFPSWPLAHPFRYVAHNGEINTVKGNRNMMRAREAKLATDLIPGDLDRIFPIVDPDDSDTASFDDALELLHLGGRSLPHAVLMMIPEPWENHTEMDPDVRAFYEYHSTLMEPWDGPASVSFTDGSVVGAVLDRNGLRPGRYWVTEDGLVVLASEAGVLDIDPATVVRKGRLQPGRIFVVDTAQGRIIEDEEIKAELAAQHPYRDWIDTGVLRLADLPAAEPVPVTELNRAQQVFGYTEEELRVILTPMARTGAEPIGSMGTDTPVAALSARSRQLFDYFSQNFAQVTNPPLDAIREEMVTSLSTLLGAEHNILDAAPGDTRRLVLPTPVVDQDELAAIVEAGRTDPALRTHTVDGTYPVDGGGDALAARLGELNTEIDTAIADGAHILVLSDRAADADRAPIPSLLLTGSVHHHLVREKTRTEVGLVIEAADVRECHHVALLIGYGASAVNPYLALATVRDLVRRGTIGGVEEDTAVRNTVKAFGKGVLKVMSKIGVSTVSSYTGAQIFEALGLGQEVIDRCFTGTTSRLGGVGFDVLAEEVAIRHRRAHTANPASGAHRRLETGGEYQWRREGEPHLFNPETVFKLQHSTRTRRYEIFKEYTGKVDDQAAALMTLRGLFRLKEGVREPVPLDEVEPVSEIVKRFSTGAMSYGSISAEAHETLAIAMNRLGGKSNTGEGGEDPARFTPDANGDLRRSAIKQVASGRFGVTSHYLTNADDIQIKMAQGAKPGEGGQLPGHKVYPWVADTRHSTPGVGLISPPPHHDIYSIEDLAQLIHDLKNANPSARVHVKLVSEAGVGTVAAGVSKAHADVVLISGHDGGTGASPLTSLKHAGTPWELGLAETQQTLLLNGLRDRIVVQADGQMKTGRDVIIAALLGAEEFGFATAPLVVSGCVMMRVCHLDTCPVGVATQNPALRERFSGKAEYVVNFFEFIAQEVREYLAELGFRSLDEAIGAVDLLDTAGAVEHWKAKGLDLSPILHEVEPWAGDHRVRTRTQDHGLEKALDNTLIQLAEGALDFGRPVRLELPVRNVNRTVGTMLGHEVTKRYGAQGLPDDTIDVTFTGSAGQSFGAFVPRGVTLRLHGDGNDYVGKGLSGGRVVVRPADTSALVAEDHIIAGNVIGYGATSGEIFLRGVVGERFCVRNSGALAVVEGIGDHGCEYMTGGRAVVLGRTGRNFAAGMSGGTAYVLDLDPHRVNTEMVEIEELTDEDREFLTGVLARHRAETGSAVAERLLADGDAGLDRIAKVMPRDYKRVLLAQAEAEREGRDVDEAVMASAQS
ncbi:glutamate synthase (NADPH/NADH) large chain [Nocardiopsis flavescens]|uniref:Glutamate synthase (NADPH/NADH) large chain n=1 Tax=Nocardiopsis flavescens TaxID=758803 RepID=A0A1M6HTD7_9ACTN|nr:glutamate synthase large subunit [Nocardiopsis flavescens]SHJ25417.1 glutamate synthase (NADPH/NADH) large chain [Nocardiopsis flavescens]